MAGEYVGYLIIAAAALLVTFFGLGPVVLADGSAGERVMTLLAVLCLYLVLGAAAVYWRGRYRRRKG